VPRETESFFTVNLQLLWDVKVQALYNCLEEGHTTNKEEKEPWKNVRAKLTFRSKTSFV
jgi:hypothetical protein